MRTPVWCSLAVLLLLAVVYVGAQEVLPPPPPTFKGEIGLSYKDSKPDFPKPVQAPKGAPNVLLILLDDMGYGVASAYGGPVNMPTLQRLAQQGLQYTNFHTTAL